MNILHILWSGQIGGIERVVYDLCVAQKKTGLNPAVLFGVGGGIFYERLHQQNIPVTALAMKHGFDLRNALKASPLKDLPKPDILHFHAFIPAIALTSIFYKKPIVYTEHGNFGSGRRARANDRLKNIGKMLFFQRVRSITANSFFTAGVLEKRFKVSRQQMRMIYNGVDLETFSIQKGQGGFREELKLGKDVFCIGTVCRLARVKRLDRLITSFAHFVERNPSARLILVGDGPERVNLELLVHKCNIADKSIFTGYRHDIPDILSGLDLFVISTSGEPFGLSALEAMAQGVPVFCFHDGGGVREIVSDVNELLIANDPADLAIRMERLSTNKDLLHSLSKRSIAVSKSFGIAKMEMNFRNLYQSIS